MKSSLSFQMLLHLGMYLDIAYGVLILLCLGYKYTVLPYPASNLILEVFLLACLALCEALRTFFAWKGNLTEQLSSLLLALLFYIPGILGVVFFLIWQTYILRLEVIFSGVVLAMQGLHFIFNLIAIVTLSTLND